MTRLIISSEDLRCRREDGSPEIERTARILANLISSEKYVIENLHAITLDVMGRPTDPEVRDYLAALHSFWPLWMHFLAFDHSLEFLVSALYGEPENGAIEQEDVLEFIEQSKDAIDTYYRVHQIPLDAKALEQEVLQYFKQRGLIHANA